MRAKVGAKVEVIDIEVIIVVEAIEARAKVEVDIIIATSYIS